MPRALAGFDRHQLLARLLRLGRQQLVRRDEPLVEPRAEIAHVATDALERSDQHLLGLARRHQGPEGARNLEPQVRASRRQFLAGRLPLGMRRALERIETAAGVEQPLQVEPGPEIVRQVGIHDLPRLARLGDHELLDVVRAGIARQRGDARTARRGASLLDRCGRITTGLELGQSKAVGEPLHDGILQGQRRLLRVAGPRPRPRPAARPADTRRSV